jgi:hypothetical protein
MVKLEMYLCSQNIKINFFKLYPFVFNLLIPLPFHAIDIEIKGFEDDAKILKDRVKNCKWIVLSGKKELFKKSICVHYSIRDVLNSPDIDNYFDITGDISELATINHNKRGIRIISNIIKKGCHSQDLYVKRVIDYLTKNLTYTDNPESRMATKVLEKKESDCGGYHTLFCALLRANDIPSIIDSGFRIDKGGPHVWSWWYDKQKNRWEIVDVNDIQQGSISISPRVSFGYGLGISNLSKQLKIPKYVKRRVSFIQSFCAYPTFRLVKLETEFVVKRNIHQ